MSQLIENKQNHPVLIANFEPMKSRQNQRKKQKFKLENIAQMNQRKR